jgi:quercetin dioxygenase-like cupin family protein
MDLGREIAALRGEPPQGTSSPRQKALYTHGPLSVNVFCFDPGGGLKDHVVRGGSVAIQVLNGNLVVKTSDAEYGMGPGHLLILSPGVVHSVRASEPTDMLLTVHLQNPD